MALTQIQLLQINRQTDRILKAPVNRAAGDNAIEITFVLDESASAEFRKEASAEIVRSLKMHDSIFRNIRCSIVHWSREHYCRSEVVPMTFIQLGRGETDREAEKRAPLLSDLTPYLKLHQARSRCIFVITEGNYEIGDREKAKQGLYPFLKSRILMVQPQEFITGTSLLMKI